ncbi:hypothetical protein [Kordiimonas sp.]|uniref:hypothetical protein n=1 Tax=Kordiimonas sp. TaxID=1970157 RepID=UPI003A9277A9
MAMDGTQFFNGPQSLSRLICETDVMTRSVEAGLCRTATESLMRLALPYIDIETLVDVPANERGYARKLLYTHPQGLFSVLGLRWMPGACTPVHGHNAWGCVGVVDGEIGCETFKTDSSGVHVESTGIIRAGKGAVASVDPNPSGIHRLFNPTERISHTLHIYGMDLAENPCAINVPYTH